MGIIGLQRRLDSLEDEFRRELLLGLRAACQDDSSQFFRSEEHNPFRELKSRSDELTDELLIRAKEILKLRRKLKDLPSSSIAAKFVRSCERFNDLTDQHRPGVRKHAQALLDEIER